MVMWVNVAILGAVLSQLKSQPFFYVLAISFVFSFLAVLLLLYSLIEGNTKALGAPNTSSIEEVESDQYEHIRGLIVLIQNTKAALDHNKAIVERRALYVSKASRMTFSSLLVVFVYIVVLFNIYYLKGGNV